ncbi:MAG: efflux transporter outer membrane subunit [Beijerinckiaceae bacterium]|nr:efflux transporter outer membrane subunit [Beijerinckiaceae bacterium]
MRRTLAFGALLITLGGCSFIPNYERPALPVAGQYPLGAKQSVPGTPSVADLEWQSFFRSPVSRELITLALDNNRDLRVAVENIATAQANFHIQNASLFPAINAAGSGQFQRTPADVSGSGSVYHLREYSLGASAMSYELDLFGKIRSQAKQAEEQSFSTAETRWSTQISLIAQVESEYLAWLADEEAVRLSEDTARAQKHSFDLRKMTMSQGSGNELDVAQAETTYRTAQASVARYTRQAGQDMDELVLLIGASIPDRLRGQMMAEIGLKSHQLFPPVTAGLPSDLLQRRPDVRAAEYTLLAANANIGAARAAFYPSVTLTGSGGAASSGLNHLFKPGQASLLFEPQVSVPIFDAGKNLASLDTAEIEKRIEIANYEKAIQSAFHDVSDALIARAAYTSQLRAQEKLVEADQRYYDLSKARFETGADNFLNVLVAQNSLFSAQLDLVTLRLSERQNLVSLYKALGGGWVRPGLVEASAK